jgi:hypothetical protein
MHGAAGPQIRNPNLEIRNNTANPNRANSKPDSVLGQAEFAACRLAVI